MRRRPATLHRLAGRALVVLLLGFLILPAAVVAIAAFNERALLAFPPQGFSLRWFTKAFDYRDFQIGWHNGAIVMLAASSLAVVVGTGFAFVLDRYRFVGRGLIETLLLAPLVVPHFTVGLGFLLLAAQVGLMRGFTVVIACHVVLVLPFVLRSVYISLRNLDRRLELAAESLGARPARVLFTVTLPLLVPGIVSGFLFAAILSFNEFTASLFVTAQRTQTLPVAMYNYVREYADPTMAAMSLIFILATTVLLTLANAVFGLGKVLNVDDGR
ncbi:MAG TPA: ABC transporter permease [Xanthobacteraceae bacterium]|nr:ABC transporter permease [Xanthobacteraceae bacterium]